MGRPPVQQLMIDSLWCQARTAFEFHRYGVTPRDSDAQTALNRIAAKCLNLSAPQHFDSTNCGIRHVFIEPGDLPHLERYHSRNMPARGYEDIEPIVIVEIERRRVVIDGNTRVNRWIARGKSKRTSAIIITPNSGPKPS
jgi:hypothetical protein